MSDFDPDYWAFSNEDGKLDRQYNVRSNHKEFCAAVDEAVAYSKEIAMNDNHEFQPMPQNPNWCARFGCMKDREHHMTTTNPLAALTPAQLAAIRAVILEVIDDGDKGNRIWYLYSAGDYSNQQRLDFCDEIQRRIVARGAPATVSGREKAVPLFQQNADGSITTPDVWKEFESVEADQDETPATVRGGTR